MARVWRPCNKKTPNSENPRVSHEHSSSMMIFGDRFITRYYLLSTPTETALKPKKPLHVDVCLKNVYNILRIQAPKARDCVVAQLIA